MLRRALLALSAVAAVLALGLPAQAIPVGLDPYEVSVTIGGDTYALYQLPTVYTESGDGMGGTYVLDADQDLENGAQAFVVEDEYSISWSSQFDVDPFVTNVFSTTNFTANPLTIDITVSSPVVSQTPGTIMGGSVGLTLTNTGGVATASTDSGIAVYTALIDNSPVQSLLVDPYTLTEAVFLGTETDSAEFGTPFPGSAISGPAANSTIGIRIRLILSPGDSIAVTSVFNVEADAPEPAWLGLAGALAGVVLVRRRA